MKFNKFVINKQWQQFEKVDLEFNKKVTVLTGANGSGKTTILNLLARHYNWQSFLFATPIKDKISRAWHWLTGWSSLIDIQNDKTIGFIEYSNGAQSKLLLPSESSVQYQIELSNQQSVECFFIPSHRAIFRYKPLQHIPTLTHIDKKQAFDKVSNSARNRYFGSSDESSSFYMKETLIIWSIFGRGNQDMEANEILLDYFQGFEKVLQVVLPKDLGFRKFVIRNFEVVLICDSGEFIIDAVSGGISAIIDMAWQLYMYSTEKNNIFTVLIDEIENHLHPTMQRRLLSDFSNAFPQVNFIVTTHSPLIVGSVKDSEVYVLRHNENKKVVSEKLDFINKAKSANEVLDEVLGVSFTLPIWAEEELKQIVLKYSSKNLEDIQTINEMRIELNERGLGKLVPQAITNLAESTHDKDKKA